MDMPHAPRALVWTTIAVSLLALTGGCSPYRDPAIAINSAKLADKSDEALALQFTLDLNNPNSDPLKLSQFEYDVSINGVKAYSGLRSAQATLASSTQRQLQIPAIIRYDTMGWTPGSSLPPSVRFDVVGRLQYLTPGDIAQVLFDTGVRRPKAHFSGSGEVDLK